MAEKPTPKGIEELAQVKFVGPAKAEAIIEQLGINTVEELVEVSKNGELQKVKGIGAALAKKIHAAAKEALQASAAEVKDAQKDAPKKAAKPAPTEKTKAAPAAQKAEKPTVEKKTEKKAAAPAKVPKSAPEKMTPLPKPPAQPAKLSPRDARVLRFIETLRCPACGHDDFDRGATTLTCKACHREYNFHSGVADLAPPKPSGRSVTQRLMESRIYARFYEDIMRPRLTGIISDRTLGEEYILAGEMLDLEADSRLLDVAVGTANFTRYFAQRLLELSGSDEEKSLVVGMDLSWPMLETARTYLRRDGLDDDVFLIRGDAARIPARRGAYNRLHCAGALHLMDNIDEALRNFARVLEADGICVISTFIQGDGLLRRTLKRAAEVPTQFHWFTREELHQRLRRAGFEVMEDSIAGDAITVKALRT